MTTDKNILEELFTTVKRESGEEDICFSDKALHAKKESKEYKAFRAVSDAMHDSGLSFNFTYPVAKKAVDILLEIEDWNADNDDGLHEAIDNAVPVYNSELMTIYEQDWSIVDEACEETGNDNDSVTRAQSGWYKAISDMVQAIKTNLDK